MLFDNLPLPLPWYPSVTLQDRFRQNVAMNAVITQLAPKDGLLPFQCKKNAKSELPVIWVIKCTSSKNIDDYMTSNPDPVVVDLSDFIVDALEGVTKIDPADSTAYDYIIFKNGKNVLDLITPTLADGLPPGVYYMEMNFNESLVLPPEENDIWTSETFRVPAKRFTWDVPSEDCCYPCFKWSHDSDITPIHYNVDDDELFYNLLYLDTWITASEPEIDDEGKEDGFKEFHPTSRKLIVKYRISTIIPDYIKVALYTMLLHENKYLFTEKSLREGEIKNVAVSSSLSVDGALSTVEILFEQMSLMVKTNCDISMDEPPGESLIAPPMDLDVSFCEPSGDIGVIVTGGPIPAGVYGELWGAVGVGAYTLLYSYISKAVLVAGTWTGNIGASTGINHFKIKFRTFDYYVDLETTGGAITPTC